jgi:hypothetical protein
MSKNEDMLTRLASCAELSKKRNLMKQEIEKEASKPNNPNRNLSIDLLSDANNKLNRGEQLGLFNSYDIAKSKSFPTLLGRLPIFIPGPSGRQKEMIDDDLALVFETPFGRGRRFGPPVTCKDEEVLFALLRLSEKRLIGRSDRLPVPLESSNEWLLDNDQNLTVQITMATVGQIIEEMSLTLGGNNYKYVVDSIKRLNQISIELETRKQDMYFGESWTGGKFRIVDIQWKTYHDQGLVYCQFTPLMAKWLKEHATYYSWDIRRQLKTDNAKALHRFLSTQGKSYSNTLVYIAKVIEWYGNKSRLRPQMQSILETLRDDFSWCDFRITGNGRKTPFTL